MPKAVSTYMTFLMKGVTSGGDTTWSEIVPIKNYPDLIGEKEQIEVTDLESAERQYIPGLANSNQMQFLCNYTVANYSAVKALAGTEQQLAVWFGGTVSGGVVTPSGSDGKFEFTGFVDAYINGKGVNDPREFTVTVSKTSDTTVTLPA